jgi:hypothetical protein
LTKGESPTFGPVTARLVEYGVAHLRDEHQGQIVEPLPFLSLYKWLQTHPSLNLEANIGSRLASQSSRGSAYEELVILYLLRALRYPVPLKTIFKFHGTAPPWADQKVQIFGRLNGIAVAVDVIGESPQNPGLGVVHYAANISEVLDWIENTTTTMPAVLVPSNLFGPDVIVSCGGILLMGQLKSYTQGNKESLDAKTASEALTSLHPDHWFKTSVRPLVSSLCPAVVLSSL